MGDFRISLASANRRWELPRLRLRREREREAGESSELLREKTLFLLEDKERAFKRRELWRRDDTERLTPRPRRCLVLPARSQWH